MIPLPHTVFRRSAPVPFLSDSAPVREELFGVERLEQHAESLAAAQRVTRRPPAVPPLRARLDANAAVLLAAYRSSAAEMETSHTVVPAAEWLLDNYHLVEAQIREIRDDLPAGFYRQLPKLADGPFVGYPRVFGLAWAFVAHTDSHFDQATLRRFLMAYQSVQPLEIGELWAVAITLRIVLVENLRRLSDQISIGRRLRAEADTLADAILKAAAESPGGTAVLPALPAEALSERFAAQIAKRLRDQDPQTTPALGWLEGQLRKQGRSVEEVVHNAQQRQGASNVTVRNIITSMRLISDLDWTEMFESVSLVDARLVQSSGFAAMDFATRNQYRSAIELLARGSRLSELEVTDRALALAEAAGATADADDRERVRDPGYHLISDGRAALEHAIGFRQPVGLRLNRFQRRMGIGGYLLAIQLTAVVLVLGAVMAIGGAAVPPLLLALFAAALYLPATEVAATVVNRLVAWNFGANALPALALTEGIPEGLRTLVVVPTLMTGEADLLEQIERLEVHFLSGNGGDISFALVADGIDWATETRHEDVGLIDAAHAAIDRLNARHGPAPGGPRFLFLIRRRLFDAGEGTWMGWERKRGKLHELNRLLRGATDTSFLGSNGRHPVVPADVRYVVTLDADTRLPRDTAGRLVGKMAHPLNRPVFDAARQRVVGGYGILQPRVTPSLPVGSEGSAFQRVYSAPGGMDPYAAAVSDVYQDLFGEGSYTGKGIYEVDIFEAALAGRVPDDTMLSHDLFEGVYARAGLASDVEVVEDFPARYDVSAKRQHRWMRGDWQLLPWILGLGKSARPMPAVGRVKMLDNLRRSLLAPTRMAALALAFLMPLPAAVGAALLVLATLAIPAFLPIAFSLVPSRSGIRLRSHLARLSGDVRAAAQRVALDVVFLADHAAESLDAITRTLVRLVVTRRNLLEWTTAASSSAAPRTGLAGFARRMAPGMALGVVTAGVPVVLAPGAWPLALAFAGLWIAAPAVAFVISRAPHQSAALAAAAADPRPLRLIARRTWRYFETFVTPADSMLPPDNFQETPSPVVAHRTSPTNIGLYLLSAVVARDFGWTGANETADRLDATFASLRRMRRFKGHFFNWYETTDLRVLDPQYVSSVDSGNLAGHLIAFANACDEWAAGAGGPDMRAGMSDTLALALEALDEAGGSPKARAELRTVLDELAERLADPLALESLSPVLRRLTDKASRAAVLLVSGEDPDEPADVVFWTAALGRLVGEEARDRASTPAERAALAGRLTGLAAEARRFALAMDFAFLLDPDRNLLSIGYSVPDNGLDANCYDLLASEARLASLFAIAKGDVPTRHWFRLGRAATPLGAASALISWSGSMFEYLMPSLVMRAPAGSLLEQTNRLVVARQQDHARRLGVPWGISESAFSARDLELTYQYSNFGVPGLGLKRGLADNTVIAPYATGLAAMVDPVAALANFRRLETLGAKARFGFIEALDYTPSRLPVGGTVVLVRNFMAHHQGMTIVAIANALEDGRMRACFHREPMIQASELLLQERMPRDVPVLRPKAEEVRASERADGAEPTSMRRHALPMAGPPVTHLLSNGRYSVMLTAAGAGYSRWGDLAVTRWQEDATRETGGSLIFLRDVASGDVWSAADRAGPSGADAATVTFREDHAEFTSHRGTLVTTMDVLVSGENDGEVRRVSLANHGRKARDIELTTYAELVLTTPTADAVHPAFAKMFVETAALPDFGAVIATRRPRSPDEPRMWAAHFAVVEGEIIADPTHETDRARFHGGARSTATAPAVRAGAPLSGTVGTVLDPIFSIRRRVRVPPGRVVRVAFWTVVADTREGLLDLVDTHHDRNAFDRAKTLAWTQAQVELRHLGVTADEAADFQRAAAPILYADRRFRPAPEALSRGLGAQSGLWPLALSGDIPIVVLRIDDVEDMRHVRQVLRAHEYWRSKQLRVDVVILNERTSSYIQDLQTAVETAVRSSQARPRLGTAPTQGTVTSLRTDLMSAEARALLLSSARLVLVARLGSIADQLMRLRTPTAAAAPAPIVPGVVRRPLPREAAATAAAGLEFFNGLGGFAEDGREYVTVLGPGQVTPAPWINVIANAHFGFHVSAEGSGTTWAASSRENQLTAWSNDPVLDPSGEALLLRDEETGALFGPTAHALRDGGVYVARHGFGYSRFEHEAEGIALDLVQFVPLDKTAKISRLSIRNTGSTARRLSVTGLAEWVLGTARGASAPFIATWIDAPSGAMMARNPWSNAFGGRVAFADLGGRQTAWTADRTEFLGRGGPDRPAGLDGTAPLSGAVGAGLDPCAALQTVIGLAPGESTTLTWTIGQAASAEEASALVLDLRNADPDAMLAAIRTHWAELLGAVQVRTPDRAMDVMLNGWLLYQTLACRITARSAFYQASGAYGFRDQLQDTMALTFARPEETRRHLLRVAGRQFPEGDVQHWWLPHSGQGVRTRISDDRVWLGYAAATYVTTSGDAGVLDERVPFLEGPDLRPGEHDAFFQPTVSEETATLFEHCARGIDQCIALTGAHGLPLIGTGDWNDGMNRVGEGGRGESVWLGWLLVRTIALLGPIAEGRDPARAARWRAHAAAVAAAIERDGWDGAWYRRATFDDGAWLGSATSGECTIDSIAQSWAVLSGAADPVRAAAAMAAVETHLVRRDDGIALLFTPPFDRTERDPGYIKGYPPGLRENGGQYSHAAMWAILAFARLGDGDRAAALFQLLNPINHARTPAEVHRYKVEPYAVAADVYSVAPHVGRGGWTWYTGAAGWMYRAGVEGILGIRREGDHLVVAPKVPASWDRFEARVVSGSTRYDLVFELGAPMPGGSGEGAAGGSRGDGIRLPLDGGRHALRLPLGV
ncbi:GH36-type glycosyl hydrolase domain-containing protein [Mongoliimonas terrestris]|uniref:GH36-type glycosyl hydrolase domain-containing protein n=1 Tax=Mongoliimonas terrestris TaxID=1709001 RepID=UPI0009497823|nr:glucoamylase family protein [Mongoliimonas terrestris]